MSSDMQNKSNEAPAMIEPRPDCRHILERTALLVSKKGLEMETKIRNCNLRNKKFNFLNSSDPCHAFYQQKLTEYREAQEPVLTECKDPSSSFSFEPEPPHWITLKERAILKLTAKFVVRYGMPFFQALMNIATANPQLGPQLRFMEYNDPRCYYFTQLVSSYPNKADGASIETLVNVFLQQLQLLLDKQDDDDGLEMSMSDLDAVVGCVDHMEEHQEGEPKRQ
ncbi:hypothetical protein Bca52824_013524 [Brassica carinata]|uniref:SURP motif domain-containing protein n=1 Tax=Brassica carinata TaxID=52824 RepID=A0A8X7VZ38_BRACI|nr:hypothetical protein Bca52824_013524 [Brassica carinata]